MIHVCTLYPCPRPAWSPARRSTAFARGRVLSCLASVARSAGRIFPSCRRRADGVRPSCRDRRGPGSRGAVAYAGGSAFFRRVKPRPVWTTSSAWGCRPFRPAGGDFGRRRGPCPPQQRGKRPACRPDGRRHPGDGPGPGSRPRRAGKGLCGPAHAALELAAGRAPGRTPGPELQPEQQQCPSAGRAGHGSRRS